MAERWGPRDYFRPGTMEQATGILADLGRRAKIIAGGTDLLVRKPASVQALVDVADLNLSYIRPDGDQLAIGAGTTVAEIADAARFFKGAWSLLPEAARLLGTPAVRNRATIGGNVANASPAADLAVALTALEAVAVVAGDEGYREIRVDELFSGVNETALGADEMLMEFRLPAPPPGTGAAFIKLRRQQTSVDIATLNVAVRVGLAEGVIRHPRIVLGAVAPTPIVAERAAVALVGEEPTPEILERAARLAAEDARPIDDVRASAAYRRRMVVVLTRRALEAALGRC